MKKYITKTALLHNNTRYAEGAEIELEDDHAKLIAHYLQPSDTASNAIASPEITDQMIIDSALAGITDDATRNMPDDLESEASATPETATEPESAPESEPAKPAKKASKK